MLKTTDNTPYEKIGDEVRSLADEIPFDIPDSWEWVRLGSAFAIEMGQSPAGNTVSENCSGTEFHQGKVFFGEKYIKASDQYTSSPTKFAPENSVLLCVRAPVGKVNITDRELCIGRGLCAIIPLAGMPLLFAYYLLAAYENIFVKQATGTTFIAITAETVKNQLIPMPPLAEQQRIADLIERLIPYVNEYGKAESAVDQLNCHFPEILKKSILQEAVQGKLVPQDPSDEPAEALLERIRAEKQRLIKEGKIKKDKHESVIFRRDNSHYEKLDGVEHCIDDDLPFEIPENWCWCKIGTIFTLQAGKNIQAAEIHENPFADSYPCYGGNGIRGYVATPNRTGDYPIIGRQGALCGNINRATGVFYATEHAVCVETYSQISVAWACLFLTALNLNQYATATAQPGLAVANINEVYIPLPPLAEQHRIIQRIEESLPLLKGL